MSLNFDLTDIADHESVCWDHITDPERVEHIKTHGPGGGFFPPKWFVEDDGTVKVMNSITHQLIFAMLELGVKGKITASNVDEVITQVAITQRLRGPYLRRREGGEWIDVYITEEDIRRHIGLRTNAFGSGNTLRGFKERMWKQLREDALGWLEARSRGEEGV